MISGQAFVYGARRTVVGVKPSDLVAAADALGARRLEYWGEVYMKLGAEWVFFRRADTDKP